MAIEPLESKGNATENNTPKEYVLQPGDKRLPAAKGGYVYPSGFEGRKAPVDLSKFDLTTDEGQRLYKLEVFKKAEVDYYPSDWQVTESGLLVHETDDRPGQNCRIDGSGRIHSAANNANRLYSSGYLPLGAGAEYKER